MNVHVDTYHRHTHVSVVIYPRIFVAELHLRVDRRRPRLRPSCVFPWHEVGFALRVTGWGCEARPVNEL